MAVRDGAVSLYREGVRALVDAAGDHSALAGPAVCGHWSGADLVRHVVAVADWYHAWLDRALDGDASPPFPAAQLAARNDLAIEELASLPVDDAVARFESSADSYLERALEHLDLPFGFPFGTVTVGLHLGAAATEWHLHAWDLNRDHAPSDPGALFTAAARCVAATEPPARRWILGRLIPLGARLSPWTTLLRRSGRRL